MNFLTILPIVKFIILLSKIIKIHTLNIDTMCIANVTTVSCVVAIIRRRSDPYKPPCLLHLVLMGPVLKVLRNLMTELNMVC